MERECQDLMSGFEWESVEIVIVDSNPNFQIWSLCWEWEERNSMRKKQRNVDSRLSYTAYKIGKQSVGVKFCLKGLLFANVRGLGLSIHHIITGVTMGDRETGSGFTIITSLGATSWMRD